MHQLLAITNGASVQGLLTLHCSSEAPSPAEEGSHIHALTAGYREQACPPRQDREAAARGRADKAITNLFMVLRCQYLQVEVGRTPIGQYWAPDRRPLSAGSAVISPVGQ